jgi:tetratricopeptide (TPR) repeat protein
MPMRHLFLLFIATLLTGCVTVAEKEAFESQPMYGQPEQVRSDYLKWEDATFIKQTSQRFSGDLKRASRVWTQQGNELLQYGDVEGAMRKFNQAWLLDDSNYQVYWGFGQVLVIKDELASAERYLLKANVLIDDHFQTPALLTDLGTVVSLQGEALSITQKVERDALFLRANNYFESALEQDAGYFPVWQRWAQSLYREGKYTAAWETIHEAQARGVKQFSKRFIEQLSAKQPEPR